MALLQGTKRWTLFARDETAKLGPSYAMSLDPCFDAEADLEGDAERRPEGTRTKHAPQAANAVRWEGDLEPGQVLFVPSGCAHCVTNLTNTLAISANYVDGSNVERAVSELEYAASEDARSMEVSSGQPRP